MTRDVEVGQRLGERFVVLGEVARGGMGIVYRARDERDGDEAALKVLSHVSGSGLARFEREAAALATLTHPNVVRYRAHGRDDGRPWLAMDWLVGASLSEALDDGEIDMRDVAALALAVCRGLEAAHTRGIVHRDLKPSNVFLPQRDPSRAVLLDFGVAHIVDATRLTDTGTTLGTPAYMAPEQARGSRDVDHRADLYALGAVLFECLAGRPPFMGSNSFAVLAKRLLEDAPPLSSVVGGVPPSLTSVVDALLDREPSARPADIGEVSARLETASFEPLSVVPKLRGRPVGTTGTEQRIGSVLLASSGGDDTLSVDDARADQDAVRRIASTHGATVQLASSHAVMLTFTRETAIDSASGAARCALALRSAWPGRAVAVATGDLVLGLPTIAGDAVDRAAELLDADRGIGVDETTRELLGPRFVVARHEEHWRLVDERSDPSVPDGALALTGRHRELRRMVGAYEDVLQDERPAVVIVTGPAGMGKSRLAAEGLRKLREAEEALQVLVATGRPAHRDVPFSVAAQLVRASLDDAATAEAKSRFLANWASTPGPSTRDPVWLQRQLTAAFTDWLCAVAKGPVVLLLEDLHWGDRPSVELLDASLSAVEERPVLVVALGRPELHERFGGGWRAHDRLDLRLAPLKLSESCELLTEMGIAPSVAHRIASIAEGNPFALLEMGRAERRGTKRVPGTVLAAAQARLDELSTGARKAARAASVYGRRFEPTGVAAVLGTPLARVRPWLDELVISAFVERSGPGLRFAHDILVEATYATMVPEDRSTAHAAAARFLDGRPEVEPDELSHHYRDGGDLHRARWWTMRAAERALGLGDLERALAVSTSAAETIETDEETEGRLALVAAEVHIWQGRHDQATEHGRRALKLLPSDSVHGFRAAGLLFDASRGGSHSEHLSALVDACADAMPASAAETERWLALAKGAQFATRIGDYGQAERAAQRLEQLPVPPSLTGHFDVVHAMLHLHRGDVTAWRSSLERALRAFTESGDLRNACWLRGEIGFAASEQGAYHEAETMLGPALDQARELELDQVAAWLLLLRGPVLARVRGLEAGIAAAREAVAALEPLLDPRLEGAAHAYLGALLLEAEDVDGAAHHAAEALQRLGSFAPLRPLAMGLGARVAVRQGDPARGLARAREARAAIDELGGVEEGDAQVDLAAVEALLALGRDDDAKLEARAGLERLEARVGAMAADARPTFMAIPIHATLVDYARSKRLSSR